MTKRKVNVKNRSSYFYNDLINILSFEASNLKIRQKELIGFRHVFLGYVDKKT